LVKNRDLFDFAAAGKASGALFLGVSSTRAMNLLALSTPRK